MPSIEISLSTSARQLLLSPSPVSLDISAHEIAPTLPSSNDLPSATSVFSQPFDNPSSLATRSTHEDEFDDVIAISTSEFLASVPEVQDHEATNVPTSREVVSGNIGEHALAAWLSSFSEFDTEEDSEELYSAIQSDPVHAEPDPNDECHAPTALTSSRVHISADSAREESNGGSGSSLVSSLSASHVPTPLPRDPQPSSLLESPSSSFDSVTSLSVFSSVLSTSSSSLFVPSSSLSSSRASLCSSPASIVPSPDRVLLPPSISLFSIPSSLSLPSVPPSVYDPSPIPCLSPVFVPCTSVSDVSLSSSHSAEVCPDASVTHEDHVDTVQLSPTERPPEDPPPDVADELKDWLQAYMSLGIAEPVLPSTSGPPPTSNDSGNISDLLSPANEFGADPLPFSDIIENSPLCSRDSNSALLASRDDERGFRSPDPLSSAVPRSTSFDDSRPTSGYESHDIVCASRSDSDFPSRIEALDSCLHLDFAQPPCDVPALDDKSSNPMYTSADVVWPTDLSPADEYNAQSEPEPPDPSSACQ